MIRACDDGSSTPGDVMHLFDDVKRTSTEPMRYGESNFSFLNRIGIEYFSAVRSLLDAWFGKVPDIAQPDLRSRLMSRDERHFLGAFWELYLHELLTQLSYPVTIHPSLGEGTSRPDFEIDCEGSSVFVEATVVSISDAAAAAEARLEQVYDTINKLKTSDFFIGLHAFQGSSSSPSVRRLIPAIQAWLAALNPDQVTAEYKGGHPLPERTFSDSGWVLHITAIPRKEEAWGTAGRPLGLTTSGLFPVDNYSPMLRSLQQKATDHRRTTRPVIIAMLCNRIAVRTNDVERALFGLEGARLRNGVTDVELEAPVFGQGLWHGPSGPRNRHISAVVTCLKMTPEKVARTEPLVWLNPWAESPLTCPHPLRVVQVESPDALAITEASAQIHDLLGIPIDWPGPEDWPDLS